MPVPDVPKVEPVAEVAKAPEVKVSNEKIVEDFKTLLSKEVSKYCKNHMKKLYNMHLQKKKAQQAQVVHHVACRDCRVNQITGIRYKCTQRDNYNICENCEAKLGADSQYSFIKIRRPGTEPVKLICQYNRVPQSQPQSMELRHAPKVAKKETNVPMKESLIDKFDNEDLKQSNLSFGDIPLVQPPEEVNLKVSELSKSTMGKIQFVDKVERLQGPQMKYKQNLLKMMQMGFEDFEMCLAALEVCGNDFEEACGQFFM